MTKNYSNESSWVCHYINAGNWNYQGKIFFIRGLPDKKESKDDIKSNVYRY
jgi:hypothetical protein